MQNEEVVNLCKLIYSNNKEAIDLITKYGKKSSFLEAAEEFVARNKDIINAASNSNLFIFIPEELKGKIPEIKNKSGTYDNHCIEFYFAKDTSRLWFYIEIEPFDDIEKRLRFCKYLDDGKLFKIPNKALTGEAKYTKVFSQYDEIEDWDDKNLILNAMEDFYLNKAKEAVNKMTDAVNNFNLDFQNI